MQEDLTSAPLVSETHKRKGIYLLPNLFTVGALFVGFYAIVAASKGHFVDAAIAIFVAILLDGLDGRIARLLNAVSDFGAQFDSLSDMLCFGVTPALVLYSWSLSALGRPGWLIAFIYSTCTALRLARFNTQIGVADKRYFQGLPTPVPAGLVASLIWVCAENHISGQSIAPFVGLIALLLSFLKVSTIRYYSFKEFDLRGRVPFVVIPAIAMVLAFISFSPPAIFLLMSSVYMLSGPVLILYRYRSRRRRQFSKPSVDNTPVNVDDDKTYSQDHKC